MPGSQDDQSDDFISENVSSKYYSPSDFLTSKFSKKSFSILHLNIASLTLHIDELRSLLEILEHPFDIIAITETRLKEGLIPIRDVTLIGYDFLDTPTKTACGGVCLYIKHGLNYMERKDISKSEENISESIFIELKRKSQKNLIIGCIYRHHTSADNFTETFLHNILEKVGKYKNKICALVGDFNIDLLKYDSIGSSCNFYDKVTSYGFRPLILQPTRVTMRSATLIDNIFINDIEANSNGGNITASISDPFFTILSTRYI